MRRFLPALALLLAACLLGSACFHFNPVTSLTRPVFPVGELRSSLTVLKTHQFFDSKSKVYSVTIVSGVYVLDAQDEDYWYFRSPVAMQRAIHADGGASPDFFPGGIALGKKKDMIFPAAIYKSDGSMDRLVIWRFGGEFMKEEGLLWKRNDSICDPK
jgi:hypothetical protein